MASLLQLEYVIQLIYMFLIQTVNKNAALVLFDLDWGLNMVIHLIFVMKYFVLSQKITNFNESTSTALNPQFLFYGLLGVIILNCSFNMYYLLEKIYNAPKAESIVVTFIFVSPSFVMIGLLCYSFF
jgi:hypothetical protein